MKIARIDLEAELDRLFAVPPKEFVPARKALEARLRATGDAPAARRIKALKRPSVPAWAVNQLRFEAPKVLSELLSSGNRLRSRSSDIPGAMQARREAIAEARKKAAEILTAAGYATTPQTMQRVSATLEALATYGNAPDRAAAGRLTEELPAPGFDDLAALGILHGAAGSKSRANRPTSPSAAPAAAPATTPHRIEEEELRAKRTKEVADAKKKEAERAHASLLEAQKRAETLRQKREELEKALAEAERQERAHAPALSAARRASRKVDRAFRRRPARSSPGPG